MTYIVISGGQYLAPLENLFLLFPFLHLLYISPHLSFTVSHFLLSSFTSRTQSLSFAFSVTLFSLTLPLSVPFFSTLSLLSYFLLLFVSRRSLTGVTVLRKYCCHESSITAAIMADQTVKKVSESGKYGEDNSGSSDCAGSEIEQIHQMPSLHSTILSKTKDDNCEDVFGHGPYMVVLRRTVRKVQRRPSS